MIDGPPEPDVPEEMIRELGLAPGLVTNDDAEDALADEIRSQTDDIVERSQHSKIRPSSDTPESPA